jgi:hypothetical protein
LVGDEALVNADDDLVTSSSLSFFAVAAYDNTERKNDDPVSVTDDVASVVQDEAAVVVSPPLPRPLSIFSRSMSHYLCQGIISHMATSASSVNFLEDLAGGGRMIEDALVFGTRIVQALMPALLLGASKKKGAGGDISGVVASAEDELQFAGVYNDKRWKVFVSEMTRRGFEEYDDDDEDDNNGNGNDSFTSAAAAAAATRRRRKQHCHEMKQNLLKALASHSLVCLKQGSTKARAVGELFYFFYFFYL